MSESPLTENRLRLAELLASLSLAIDLGMGEPMEWVLKACLLGMRLSETLGFRPPERRDVYYVTLLRHVGCTSTADTEAHLLGDELGAHQVFPLMDEANRGVAWRYLFEHLGQGQSLFRRTQMLAHFLAAGRGPLINTLAAEHCEIAERVASQLGLSAAIQQALRQTYERWDGHGLPHKLKGEAIALSARVAYFVLDVVFFYLLGGADMAMAQVRARAGRFHDPALTEAFLRNATDLLAQLETTSLWNAVLESEPNPCVWLADEQIERALFVVADFADMKSPYLVGHSRHVANLAARAGEKFLPADQVVKVRRAGLLHDIGRVGVSAAIWGKPGPLTESEWERVRLHPHYTERIFSRSAAVAPLGLLAAQHHERLDGSGYHHRLLAPMLSPAARLLAAADVYCAMTEARPHRPAISPEAAADELRREARAKRLDADAVNAVLIAAGQRGAAAHTAPSPSLDISPRELEVLR
jgi:HD-GYP domain-containing protein (c-di-GMP phosphodiesterase class II)